MKQGTISILIGCHSPIHSYYVYKAYIELYGRRPSWRETVCIFLHDIGHWGLNYLDDIEQKKIHWQLGAVLARVLFGNYYFSYIAGHTESSGMPISKLSQADKCSWLLASKYWQFCNTVAEPKLRKGMGRWEAVYYFRAQVKKNAATGFKKSTHDLFLERKKDK